jgi:hypothetical protein
VALSGFMDDQVLQHYRALLDAEDGAFDALEHACEDGDRGHWEADVAAWQKALNKKIVFLQRLGVEMPELAST